MASYATEAASALADVTAAGAAVTFTKVAPGTYDGTTDTWSNPTNASVSGYAIRVRGNPDTYEKLNLIEALSNTLLFTPSTYGQVPALGSEVVWDGVTYTVRDVNQLAPDGKAILSRVVVSV